MPHAPNPLPYFLFFPFSSTIEILALSLQYTIAWLWLIYDDRENRILKYEPIQFQDDILD